jgi:hypothetical protein
LPTKEELIEAIKECESKESSYDNCVKLAIFYQLYDRYYGNDDVHGNSFDYKSNDNRYARIIRNQDMNTIIDLFADVLETIEVTNPKLYESVIDRLN